MEGKLKNIFRYGEKCPFICVHECLICPFKDYVDGGCTFLVNISAEVED
jgi:radical SAM superfamily enzyme